MGISTHILDTSLGRPAGGVPVSLAIMKDGVWSIVNQTVTDLDGRCKHLLLEKQALEPGIYRLHFETAAYYRQNNLAGLYPYVEIVFEATDGNTHYHIPLLLTANGYTTYRGS
jgi:5-hydroxyisourate hydrolase